MIGSVVYEKQVRYSIDTTYLDYFLCARSDVLREIWEMLVGLKCRVSQLCSQPTSRKIALHRGPVGVCGAEPPEHVDGQGGVAHAARYLVQTRRLPT